MRPSRSPSSWAAAALVAAALTPAAARGVEPMGVRAEPAALVLGTGQSATILIDAAPDAPPAVTTNVGRIENLRPLGGGRFSADYLPPPEAHPQVAIVVAVSGDRWGWTALPLSGRGVAIARSAPGAAIRVTIGDTEFGPVQADAAGDAKVPVIVPAGVAYAYHRQEPLDLKVPQTLHVHLALDRDAAAADVEQVVPFRVFAVTSAGAPRPGARIVAEVESGDVVGIVEIAPGEHAGAWRLPPGATGRVRMRVGLADEPGLEAVAAIDHRAGPPALIALAADRQGIVAGDAEPIALRVRVTDAAGNGSRTEPTLGATEGELSAIRAVEPGTWEASLRVPAARSAGQTIVTARAAGLEGRIAIGVTPRVAPAGPRERIVSVSPKAGVAVARGGVWSPAVSAEGAVRTGLLDRRLALVIEAGTFVRDRTDDVAVGDGLLAVRGRVRYVPVIASARLEHAPGPRQLAWAAAGAGVVFVDSDVSVGTSERSEAGLVAGLRAAIGWGVRAGRTTPFAEAALGWHGAPRFDALRGSLTILTFSLGCRYDAF